MSDVTSIFATLDAPFINFEKGVEPIVWQSSDILVMQTYDLKVPTLPGATVKYTFSTTLGDIGFSAEFHAPGQAPQVAVGPMRVPSDIESIKGTFKAESDGHFVLLFDNTFSWFNSKLLTYKVELYQPAFTIADMNRVKHSQRLLHTMTEDSRRAQVRLITARDRSNVLATEINSLTTRLAQLQADLENKQSVLKAAREEEDDMNARINHNIEKRNGLCIRTMHYATLKHMLSYLDKTPTTYLVCKYWKACVDDIEEEKRGPSTEDDNEHRNKANGQSAKLPSPLNRKG